MRAAYADPPYPGQSARHYKDHPEYAGEVDHAELVERLQDEYPDGWALSTSSTTLGYVIGLCPFYVRVAAWVKPFAAFKNQRVTMAWEPVIYHARNGGPDRSRPFVRDWISAVPPVFAYQPDRTDVVGTKPPQFCFWLFDLLGLSPDDEFVDLYPGSGAVGRAWEQFCREPNLFANAGKRSA